MTEAPAPAAIAGHRYPLRVALVVSAAYLGGVLGNLRAGGAELGELRAYNPQGPFFMLIGAMVVPGPNVAMFCALGFAALFVFKKWPLWTVIVPLGCFAYATYAVWQVFHTP